MSESSHISLHTNCLILLLRIIFLLFACFNEELNLFSSLFQSKEARAAGELGFQTANLLCPFTLFNHSESFNYFESFVCGYDAVCFSIFKMQDAIFEIGSL